MSPLNCGRSCSSWALPTAAKPPHRSEGYQAFSRTCGCDAHKEEAASLTLLAAAVRRRWHGMPSPRCADQRGICESHTPIGVPLAPAVTSVPQLRREQTINPWVRHAIAGESATRGYDSHQALMPAHAKHHHSWDRCCRGGRKFMEWAHHFTADADDRRRDALEDRSLHYRVRVLGLQRCFAESYVCWPSPPRS